MPGYRYGGTETITPGAPPLPYAPWGPRNTRPISDKISPFDRAKCGTYAGLHQHRRHGQDPCEECNAANAEYQREQRAKQKNRDA